MDLNELIRKANDEHVDIDFLRDGIAMLAQALMEVDVTNRIGAALRERAPEARSTQRNGYRARRWDTRAGTVELAIPKLRQGSYFPHFLLEPRRRAERALASVVMQAYVEGVSTRRVDDVAKAMGIEGWFPPWAGHRLMRPSVTVVARVGRSRTPTRPEEASPATSATFGG
ncbi:MAG: transposase, partial [Actinomycetota bacterium]|nr:transposase [Actinomycetota bacterium]